MSPPPNNNDQSQPQADQTDWIAFQYIADELPAQLRDEFEARLESDPVAQQALVDAVELVSQVHQSFVSEASQITVSASAVTQNVVEDQDGLVYQRSFEFHGDDQRQPRWRLPAGVALLLTVAAAAVIFWYIQPGSLSPVQQSAKQTTQHGGRQNPEIPSSNQSREQSPAVGQPGLASSDGVPAGGLPADGLTIEVGNWLGSPRLYDDVELGSDVAVRGVVGNSEADADDLDVELIFAFAAVLSEELKTPGVL